MIERRAVIAIVDDDVRVGESLGELLESAGYAVRTFGSAAALLREDVSDIDCLVTDIGMPEIDGFDLVERIKRQRPDTPVFMITARDDPGDLQRVIAHDINGLFRKPFDVDQLLAAIGRHVRVGNGSTDGQ